MKKVIIIVIPLLLLIAGGVVFAAMKGMINIPGLTPKVKKKPSAPTAEVKKVEKKKEEPKKEEPKKKPPVEPPPAPDMIAGAKKVAKLWNELPPEKLQKVIKDWKNPDLARVIMVMDGEKSSQLLASLDPVQASALSKEVQKQASLVVK